MKDLHYQADLIQRSAHRLFEVTEPTSALRNSKSQKDYWRFLRKEIRILIRRTIWMAIHIWTKGRL